MRRPLKQRIHHQRPTKDRRRRRSVLVCLQPRTADMLRAVARGEKRSLSSLLAEWVETATSHVPSEPTSDYE